MANKLGIIAGGGALPARLIEACRKEGREVFVVAIKGQAEKAHVSSAPHAWVRLGAAGKAVELLHSNGVKDLVLAGAFRRPSVSELFPDKTALQFIYTVGKAFFRDDALHTAVVHWLEERGFHVVAPETIDGGLLATEGVYGKVAPDDEAWSDIRRGVEVARALGSTDVGQGVVVQQGVVLALEAVEGTDAMIKRAGELKRSGRGGYGQACGADDFRADEISWMGRVLYRHVVCSLLLVIVFQVHVVDFALCHIDPERQTVVPGDA